MLSLPDMRQFVDHEASSGAGGGETGIELSDIEGIDRRSV